jgi:hypothetical protein
MLSTMPTAHVDGLSTNRRLHGTRDIGTGNAQVAHHSVGPSLVRSVRNVVCGRELPAQTANSRILLRLTDAGIGRYDEDNKGARNSTRASV